MNEWNDARVVLPPNRTDVLVRTWGGAFEVARIEFWTRYETDSPWIPAWHMLDGGYGRKVREVSVTHWMKMPPPPSVTTRQLDALP